MQSVPFLHNLAVAVAFFVFSFAAQAAANRTFVSASGNDSNASLNCGATTPCRTFGAALSVTSADGEIVVLTSGGYGPATITQGVTITAIGVTASVTVTTGNALEINTTGDVTIDGLGLHGTGSAVNGINVVNVGFLRLDNVAVEGFGESGVFLQGSGGLAIFDSYLSNNANCGLLVNSAGGTTAYVKSTVADHNGYGFAQSWARVVIEDSAARYNANAGFWVNGGSLLSLIRDEAVHNSIGIQAVGGTTQFAYSNITQNTNYAIVVAGGIIAGSNPGTSVVSGSISGLLGTASMLQ